MTRKIKIIAVGKIKEKYIQEGIAEFLKRLRVFCTIDIIEIKDEGILKESARIDEFIKNRNAFILDPKGEELSSEEFAEKIKGQEDELVLIIGGPEGIDDNIKKKSQMISLSKMTFTHEMARLFLVEQIYRAYMIINNRKYHK